MGKIGRDRASGVAGRLSGELRGERTEKSRRSSAAVAGLCLGAGLLLASGAGAADLPGRGDVLASSSTSCLISGRSPLLDLPPADVAREVEFRYGRAVATSNERSVVASARPVFPWAMEARMACGTAIGYLRGGVVDDVSVSKCDCFHDRMIGHFR